MSEYVSRPNTLKKAKAEDVLAEYSNRIHFQSHYYEQHDFSCTQRTCIFSDDLVKLSRYLYNNRDKRKVSMSAAASKIKNRIMEFKPGDVFLTGEFSDAASLATIRKTLGRLCCEGLIRRVIDGVYEKPVYSELLKEYLPVDPEKVAYALAKHYHWNIAPCGDIALNKLKLSTQVPVVLSYISDGPYRDFRLNQIRISFKHRTNRDISLMSPVTVLVIEALKTLGKENVTDETVSRLRNVLSSEDKQIILRESSDSADWIYRTVREVCGR